MAAHSQGTVMRPFSTAKLAARACLVGLSILPAQVTARADGVPPIPLVPGLVGVYAAYLPGQSDGETLLSVQSADAQAVAFELRSIDPSASGGEPRIVTMTKVVRRADLLTANRVVVTFHTEDPERFPGSTIGGASSGLLARLKSGVKTPFILGIGDGPFGGLGARKYYRGDLQRIEANAVPIPVLLNGKRTTLPAVHTRGTLSVGRDSGEVELWWLDQPDNAMLLRAIFKGRSTQLVRVDLPDSQKVDLDVASGLASAACRVELHGVYFDTGSAVLLPQSMATIAEIVTVLAGKPDWRITIEGHTDDTGSETDNQWLSKRRAESVLTALVDQYGLPAGRFKAVGFGESRPIDTNDTVEGRAHNRRVELARQCP